MINPYENVNWETDLQITSCSHQHCESQAQLNTLVQSSGIQHIAISNYYPSEPCYPLEEIYTVPVGIISSPNAEHHNMTIMGSSFPSMHLNGLGSTFESGSARDQSPVGCGGANVSVIVPQILANLQYEDGGGITINHPTWSGMNDTQINYLLDLDERMLGIEIFNTVYEDDQSAENHVENIKKWDAALKTGRRCWGFAVADHKGQTTADWMGRNILLVPSLTEYNCLKAYRNGEFYTRIKNTDLAFTSISLNGNTFSVRTENASTIKIVIDGTGTEYSGNSVDVTVPNGITYIRAEAHSANDDIYSNPIMFKGVKKRSSMTNRILTMMS